MTETEREREQEQVAGIVEEVWFGSISPFPILNFRIKRMAKVKQNRVLFKMVSEIAKYKKRYSLT